MEYYVCRSESDDKLKIEKVGDKIIFETIVGGFDSFEIHLDEKDIDRIINQLSELK